MSGFHSLTLVTHRGSDYDGPLLFHLPEISDPPSLKTHPVYCACRRSLHDGGVSLRAELCYTISIVS